ncbi:MAG: hypothetical protein ACOYM8_13280, partial [Caulobacterales bacterium]
MAASGAPLISEGGGYGLVIMRRGGPRNRLACDAFSKALPFTSEAVTGRPLRTIDGVVYRRPIYWPLNTSALPASQTTCETMVANYDYDRAAIIASRFQGGLPSGGPFVVLVRADGRRAGVFDFGAVP